MIRSTRRRSKFRRPSTTPPRPWPSRRAASIPFRSCAIASTSIRWPCAGCASSRSGRRLPGRVLAPACYRPVEPNMEVKTAANNERVRTSVKTLTQLLLADHPTPCEKQRLHGDCELEQLAKRFNVPATPFPGSARTKPQDDSSLIIAVDHNACILCDRCVRGLQRNPRQSGHRPDGQGLQDADRLRSEQSRWAIRSCVACGECMVSCPTGALVNRSFGPARRLERTPSPLPSRSRPTTWPSTRFSRKPRGRS